MSILDDFDAEAMQFTFANSDIFGEEITYTPYQSSALTFDAVVMRDAPFINDGGAATLETIIMLPRSTDNTVGVNSINVGGDTSTFKANIDDAISKTYHVAEILSQDGGSWVLRLI